MTREASADVATGPFRDRRPHPRPLSPGGRGGRNGTAALLSPPGRGVGGEGLGRGEARPSDAAFTLIETLVALAVLALSAVAILGAAQAHVARVGALEARAAALWAAQNHLAEIGLGLAPPAEPAPILGYRFRLEVTQGATADPGLTRLDITATEIGSGQSLARLTGFVLTADDGGGT